MRTTVWSLALLAGSAVAAPAVAGDYQHQPDEYKPHAPASAVSSTCTEEEQYTSPVEYSSSIPSTYSASASSTPVAPASYSHSHVAPVYSAPANYTKPKTTVTLQTTVWTTYCPETATYVSEGTTSYSTYMTHSTMTESSPAAYTTTKKEVTSLYTTVCPYESEEVHGDHTITKTYDYQTTSTVTSVYTSVITIPAGPGGYGNGGHGNGEHGKGGFGNGEHGKGGHGQGGAYGGSTTEITTTYTTVCPATTTAVHGGSTITSTYETTSTVTSVITSTVTEGGAHGPSGYQSWTTVPWGTTSFSYIVPTPSSTHSGPVGGPSIISPSHYSLPTISIPAGYPTSTYGSGNSTMPYGSGTMPHKPTSTSTSATCTKPKPTGLTEPCIPCEGQPGSNPDEWCGYTINDNYYEVMPKTCRPPVEYFFDITNTTFAPDGVERMGLLINGQMPGPKIEANWGDTIVVHVTNKMQNNGTSIHFHGIRQNYTNEMDGVASLTQCPIAPGDTMTYTFKASNYGSSWYHSHFSIQTYEGVFGPMVIHGPAAMEYDFEQDIVIQDWTHATADSMYSAAQTVGNAPEHGPRVMDTGLINGMNVWGKDGAANATGQRFRMTVIPGKTYRLRLVNVAIQSTFKFMIDGHKFKVIANDFVPIHPYETDIVNINIGQRYDLIFTADQPIGNYWMRADNQNPCAEMTYNTNVKGIVSYVGAVPSGGMGLGPFGGSKNPLPYAIPTTTARNYTPECVDEPYASLVPIVPLNAGPAPDESIDKTVLIGPGPNTPSLYKWTLSGTTFQSQWGDPTLYEIVNNNSIPTYSGDLAIQVPKLGEWVYVIIDSPIPLPHPIHLHGHDFYVLAQGKGLYDSSIALNTVNPPRRDVALMPWDPVTHTGGHLVLAFQADNPGTWLMHCHIGWHTSMGFALQIIENMEGIKDTVTNSCGMDDICKNYHAYAKEFDIVTDDSGV